MKIEQMAREAAMAIGQETGRAPSYTCDRIWLERFAALVRAQALDEAAATAKAMELGRPGHTATHDVVLYRGMVDAAILALKQPQEKEG